MGVFAVVSAMFLANAAPASAAAVQTGRAFGLTASGLIPIAPQGDTGTITTGGDVDSGLKCAATIPGGIINVTALCGQVWTGSKATGGSSRGVVALASLKTLVVNIPSIPLIQVVGLGVTAGAQCGIGTGSYSTVALLRIGGVDYIGGPSNPAPNTVYNLGVGTLTLNEQIKSGPTSITVNALHLRVPGYEDVIVASAAASVTGCIVG